jgi:hypothetical protein
VSRKPSTFRQRDLKCAVAAVRQAGVDVAKVQIAKDGTITLVTGKPESPPGKDPNQNEWDEAV